MIEEQTSSRAAAPARGILLPPDARRSLWSYNLLFPVVFAALLPGFLARMLRRGNYRDHFGQRLARYAPDVRARFSSGRWVWLHSISVGETFLALKLAREIRLLDPTLNVVLSVTTSTGFAVAQAAECDWLRPLYNPIDLPTLVKAALDAVRPCRLVFVEAIWPNLLAEAVKRGLPVGFVPRLSPRSEARFRRARRLTGPIFRLIQTVAVATAEDVARWQSLGVAPARIRVTGNVKYDLGTESGARTAELREVLRGMGVVDDALVLLGGSTFPGEEEILARVYLKLRRRFPNLFLILVPRHVERTSEVLARLRPLGLRVALRTAASTERAEPADLLVVNTTGELRDWYRLATIVFIGKSLTARGGQNPVEPVFAGRPVVYGPHMQNFAGIVEQWRDAEAAVQVNDEAELEEQFAQLLADPPRRDELTRRAAEIVSAHQGATHRTVAALLSDRPM